jgi:hypothetical protein
MQVRIPARMPSLTPIGVSDVMKKLIVSILLICLNAFADTVYVGWKPNTEPDLAGYKVYVGPASRSYTGFLVAPAPATSATLDIPIGSYIALTAFNSNDIESAFSNELIYEPVTVELVLEQSKDLDQWGGRLGVWVFRVPNVVFSRLEPRLRITRTHVEIVVYGKIYQYPISTGVGKKFFRSYVAVQP